MVRSRVLAGEPRIDGREKDMIRGLDVRTGVLPRTHGSALFTRGETQALVTATLGTARDAQNIDELMGERTDSFLFHYNFPPYSVGETGMVGSPKRREIGHGRLAKRGVLAVMPTIDEFPYTVRVVSGNHRIQRFFFHGLRLWRLSGADGCGGAGESRRCGYRNGSGERRRQLRRSV